MIYLDNAATTKPYDEVVEIMAKASLDYFANPSSVHTPGSRARARLEDARANISAMLGCKASEIYFTSGATESLNWVLRGSGLPLIISPTDHKASLESSKTLTRVHYLPVDNSGLVDPEAIRLVDEEEALVSILYVNNETGLIQDVNKLIATSKEKAYRIHIDGVQALGKININIEKLGVDYLSLSSHKIHGPKGLGLLYIKEGRDLKNLVYGGGQELGRRAGTENLPAVLGFEKALDLTLKDLDKKNQEIQDLKSYFENRLVEEVPEVIINSIEGPRVSSISSLSFKDIDSTKLMMLLDMNKVYVSAGSACTAGAVERSHVLEAMGLDKDYIGGSIRVSLSYETRKSDLDEALNHIKKSVKSLRK